VARSQKEEATEKELTGVTTGTKIDTEIEVEVSVQMNIDKRFLIVIGNIVLIMIVGTTENMILIKRRVFRGGTKVIVATLNESIVKRDANLDPEVAIAENEDNENSLCLHLNILWKWSKFLSLCANLASQRHINTCRFLTHEFF
jgi:hypothetical protein